MEFIRSISDALHLNDITFAFFNLTRRALDAASSNEIAVAFSAIILFIFFLCLIARFPGVGIPFRSLDNIGPALLTTIGVLGTFTGIFIGLLDFDVASIDSSVPKLLDGLRIAFVTSIVGMAAAITLRLIQSIWPTNIGTRGQVTPEIIHQTLELIDEGIRTSSKAQQETLEELKNSISADADSSLLTQVQKLRTTTQDGQNELIREFKEFAQNMAENNSKALIEALEEVIRDFNTNLTEQFGENFKHLNEAVGALLQWQENYREHIETLEARIEIAVLSVEASKKSLEQISADTRGIPESLQPLRQLLTDLSASLTNLEAHLEAVAALKEKALSAFPHIEENIETLTTNLKASVESNTNQWIRILDDQKTTFDALHTGFNELRNASSEVQEKFLEIQNSAFEDMQKTLQATVADYGNTIEATSDEIQKLIKKAWSETQDGIEKQFETLDENLQQELKRALELLGGNLASLSEKFVADYEPLTEKLRDLVNTAKAVP